MYVDYQFYVDEYHGGSISTEEWPAAEREAQATIRRYERIYTVSSLSEEGDKMAVCAAAEVLVSHARADAMQNSGVVASASIGSVSVAYRPTSATEKAQVEKHRRREVYEAVNLYRPIYRGVSGCL